MNPHCRDGSRWLPRLSGLPLKPCGKRTHASLIPDFALICRYRLAKLRLVNKQQSTGRETSAVLDISVPAVPIVNACSWSR